MPFNQDKPTLFLIDGNNYVFRAFYAISHLSNSKGFPTNAIFGFTNMLIKLLKEQKPKYIAVAFDVKGATFRHEAFKDYKATRKTTPEDLIPQIPYIKDIVRGFAIPVLEKHGIEADDIIGTLAKKYAAMGINVVIISGDKDLMQLVSDNIIMMDTMKDKIYDSQAVKEYFGVGPEKVTDILGLMGDASDNIPGVPGIGPKTAKRLIAEFGSLEEVLNNSEKLRNAKLRQNIKQFAAQARLSRDLATIKTDIEFDFDIEKAHHSDPDLKTLQELFIEFEFSSLIQQLKIKDSLIKGDYCLILTEDDFKSLLNMLEGLKEFSLDLLLSDTPMRAEIIGIAILPNTAKGYYIPISHSYVGSPSQLSKDLVLNGLSPYLSSDSPSKNGHDMKSTIIVMERNGVNMKGLGCDTMVASYLLNPAKHSFELPEVALEHLGRQITNVKELLGSGAKALPFSALSVEKTMEFCCQRVEVVHSLQEVLREKIALEDLKDLFNRIEMPLIPILAKMEKKGVLLDLKLLKEMSEESRQMLHMSEEKIYRLAKEKFNINSPKQIQTILFEKMGLPRGRKTKDGYSTDIDVLTSLAMTHELPAEILAYRSMAKLKSTYIDALPALVNPETGRVHTSYNQTATATGRLSSSNPNLQNIPIRTLEGKRIRQAFIAPDSWEIVSADYSQIELRILAHLSEDQTLIDAFTSGEDIHSKTASNIFGVFPEMINSEMRRQAKVINFGILYGMSAFGLSRELGVSQKLAQDYINEYFKKYKKVRLFLDGILETARNKGYVSTILNRRRYLPEINSSNTNARQFAERMAINTPIQGTAADLIKLAMINISNKIAKRSLASCMIMQVHDELVFEVPLSEKAEVMELIRQEMEGVIRLNVPLKVDIASGKNWDI